MSRLEWYMDELVECFEDFVKKSLVLLSLAVGAIVVMVFYVLKLLTFRYPQTPCFSCPSVRPMLECTQSIPNFCDDIETKSCYKGRLKCVRSNSSLNKKCPSKRFSNCMLVYPDPTCGSPRMPIPVRVSGVPSCNELVLNDIGYTNCTNDKPDPEKCKMKGTNIRVIRKSISQPIHTSISMSTTPVDVENIGTAAAMGCYREIKPDLNICKQRGSSQVIALRKCLSQRIRPSKSLNTAPINVNNTGIAAMSSYSDFGDLRRRCLYRTPSKRSICSRRSIPCLPTVGQCLTKPSPCASVTNLHRHRSRHSCCSKCCH